ncbi:hypothetical protein ACVWZ4_006159 [Bradyrhizobium sp. USDA 4472]
MAVNVAVTTTKIDLAPRHRCAGQMASGLNESQSADGLESAARLLAPGCPSRTKLLEQPFF